ncbi:MAG TPA: hypothetical protein VE732_01695, partial [Nitrososphaera sp.]|nr:hypothetical protein [Nitrososphaera sp.]
RLIQQSTSMPKVEKIGQALLLPSGRIFCFNVCVRVCHFLAHRFFTGLELICRSYMWRPAQLFLSTLYSCFSSTSTIAIAVSLFDVWTKKIDY